MNTFPSLNTTLKILLVEDEMRMSDALCELLCQEGYSVEAYSDGIDGEMAAKSENFDAIILDVMLPSKSGFSIAADLREAGVTTPILILSAKSQLEDKVYGLDRGADDYLTKPFKSDELLARLRALIRRCGGALTPTLDFGDLSLDVSTLTLKCVATNEEVNLSDKECLLLAYMINNKNRISTRDALEQNVWGYESDVAYNNVEVYISFLRKKLVHLNSSVVIKTVRSVGYELKVSDV